MLLYHFQLYGMGVMLVKYKLYANMNFAFPGLATGGMKVLVSHVTTRVPTSTLQCCKFFGCKCFVLFFLLWGVWKFNKLNNILSILRQNRICVR